MSGVPPAALRRKAAARRSSLGVFTPSISPRFLRCVVWSKRSMWVEFGEDRGPIEDHVYKRPCALQKVTKRDFFVMFKGSGEDTLPSPWQSPPAMSGSLMG